MSCRLFNPVNLLREQKRLWKLTLDSMMEGKLPKKFKCEEKLCTKAFRTGDGLKQHVKAVHWNAGGGSGDPAGLRTQMKPKKIDKSAINLLPLATLPYNMKVVILIPVDSLTIVRLICNDFISENDPMTESMIF